MNSCPLSSMLALCVLIILMAVYFVGLEKTATDLGNAAGKFVAAYRTAVGN